MKASKIIFISIIGLILVAMPLMSVINIEAFDNEKFITTVEKRTMMNLSDIEDAENKILAFEDFFNDRMPFRKTFITSYSNALHSINVSLFPEEVVYGKNGFMYLAWAQNHHRGLINSNMDHIADAMNNVKILDDYLSVKGIDFVFTVMPDKANVYPEYLPDWYTETELKSPNELILDYAFGSEGFDYVTDLKSMYIQQKETYEDYLYHKTDTHYSKLGAYFCYKDMMENLNAGSLNKTESLVLESYDILPQNNGYDLKGMSALNKEVDDFKVNMVYENATIDADYTKYQVEGSDYEEYYNEDALSSETVLFIGDSFMTYQKPFYINTYTSSYFLHIDKHIGSMRDFDLIDEIVNDINPDVVILETVERYSYDRIYKMYDRNDTVAENLFDSAQKAVLYDVTNYTELGLRNIELIEDVENVISINPSTNDPMLVTPIFEDLGSSIVVKAKVNVPNDTTFQVFYRTKDSKYSEANSEKIKVIKGDNEVYLVINSSEVIEELRFDVNKPAGCFEIDYIDVRKVK